MGFTETSKLKKEKVMYVEDDIELIEAVSLSLKESVGELIIAATAEEALEIYESKKPDIVITDVVLPCMSGIDLAKHLKAMDANIPVLIVSGYRDSQNLLDSIDAQVDGYITKPVNLQCLKQKLDLFAEKLEEAKKYEKGRQFVQKVMNNSKEMYLVGSEKQIEYINDMFLEFLGFHNLSGFSKSLHKEDYLSVIEKNGKQRVMSLRSWLFSVSRDDGYEGVVSIIRAGALKSDAKSWIARVSRMADEDTYIVSFVDVTVMEQQTQFFHNLAMKDPLTDIYNRYKFFEELKKETDRSRRYNKIFSIIMLDIDKFKLINDSFGHQVGDSVLKELTRLIESNLRSTDIFVRYGGEEFIIIAPEVDKEGTAKLAEKLRIKIAEHSFEHVDRITCSFGVSQYKEGAAEDEVVRDADEALYKAKSLGRNRVVIG